MQVLHILYDTVTDKQKQTRVLFSWNISLFHCDKQKSPYPYVNLKSLHIT